MSAATKTLELLGLFSATRPEIGLSQMCRLAQRDKATTYRHLQALEHAGFVEKNPLTKCYRLGPAVLQLARTREITVPRKKGAETALAQLADATGETAHITVLSGDVVYPMMEVESPNHSIRAVVDLQTFPLHATASGLCALAFGPEDLLRTAAERMQAFTAQTVETAEALTRLRDVARANGYAHANRSFESEIIGLSTPLYDQSDAFTGSVSVACVASRLTPDLERRILENLTVASRAISRAWGGTLPKPVEDAWARSLSSFAQMDTAS